MTNHLDGFQLQINKELANFSVDGDLIETKILARSHEPAPEPGGKGLFPTPGKRTNTPEMEVKEAQLALLADLILLDPENQEWPEKQKQIMQRRDLEPKVFGILWQQRREMSQEKAKEIIKKKKVRASLCSALKTASNDTFEIAKIITPILIGLGAAGTISIPLLPVLFAALAFTIARLGISSVCADV